ncbi:MAG: ferrichrome ABC transporter substrate-binding protein, partial [Propionibacterium sp.]|nr:ferrichrome ABC transporter substrate-binding protein [Propionibacterium sp.]
MNVRLRSLFITLVSSTLLLSACSPGSTTSGETSQSSTAAATGAN